MDPPTPTMTNPPLVSSSSTTTSSSPSSTNNISIDHHHHHGNHHHHHNQHNHGNHHGHHHHHRKRNSPFGNRNHHICFKLVHCLKNSILPIIVTTLCTVAFLIGSLILIPSSFPASSHLTWYLVNQIWACVEIFFIFLSYFQCVRTSPGYVSVDWEVTKVQNERDRVQLLELEPSKSGEARFCQKCGVFQPPRSHHSRVHNRCVLRMDHYCVWVNNVVGAFNHKYFYLFLLYLCLSIAHYFVLLIVYVVKLFGDVMTSGAGGGSAGGSSVVGDLSQLNPISFVILVIFTVFLLPVSLMVHMFFGWNTYLLMTNQTSIENHMNSEINVRLKYRKRSKRNNNNSTGDASNTGGADSGQFRHIYNVNLIDNMKSVLGERVWLWLLPVEPTGFDGYHFKTIGPDEVQRVNELIRDARPDDSAMYDESESDSDDDGDDDEDDGDESGGDDGEGEQSYSKRLVSKSKYTPQNTV